MKLAWLTDIHLNFLRPPAVGAFIEMLAETEADAVLIGGDIGEGPDVSLYRQPSELGGKRQNLALERIRSAMRVWSGFMLALLER